MTRASSLAFTRPILPHSSVSCFGHYSSSFCYRTFSFAPSFRFIIPTIGFFRHIIHVTPSYHIVELVLPSLSCTISASLHCNFTIICYRHAALTIAPYPLCTFKDALLSDKSAITIPPHYVLCPLTFVTPFQFSPSSAHLFLLGILFSIFMSSTTFHDTNSPPSRMYLIGTCVTFCTIIFSPVDITVFSPYLDYVEVNCIESCNP